MSSHIWLQGLASSAVSSRTHLSIKRQSTEPRSPIVLMPAGFAAPVDPEREPDPNRPGRLDRVSVVYAIAALSWFIASGVATTRLPAVSFASPVVVESVRACVFVVLIGMAVRRSVVRYRAQLAAATEAQQRARQALREMALLRSRFLRSVSHELRTPLTNIVGYGITLNDHLARLDLDTATTVTERLVANARRLEQLVLDLLDLERQSPTVTSVRPEAIQLDLLIKDVLDRVPQRDHRMHLRADSAIVHLDPHVTERIIEELVRNATRHTPDGTQVWVSASIRSGYVCLTVEDNGPGVDPNVLDDVFEPFIQGGEAEFEASPGLGIGLAVVKRNVALQRGRVEVSRRVGGGVRFTVVLPRSLQATAGTNDPELIT